MIITLFYLFYIINFLHYKSDDKNRYIITRFMQKVVIFINFFVIIQIKTNGNKNVVIINLKRVEK